MINTIARTAEPRTKDDAPEHHHYLEAIGKIYFYVYASEATRPFDAEELRELLRKSRQTNAALGVSGMLLYKAGCFLQLLEGPRVAIGTLVEKIARDPRHRNVTMLAKGFENDYQFADWSMGFHDLESAEARAIPGYSDFLETSLHVSALTSDPTLGQRLLLAFKKVA